MGGSVVVSVILSVNIFMRVECNVKVVVAGEIMTTSLVRVTGGSVTVLVRITVFVGGSGGGVVSVNGRVKFEVTTEGPLLVVLVARFVVESTVLRDDEVEVALVCLGGRKGIENEGGNEGGLVLAGLNSDFWRCRRA